MSCMWQSCVSKSPKPLVYIGGGERPPWAALVHQGNPPWVGRSGREESFSNPTWIRTPSLFSHLFWIFHLFPHGLSLADFVSTLYLISHPINPRGPLGSWWAHPVGPRNPFVTPGTLRAMPENLPESKYNLPIYQPSFLDHFGTPRDVWDLIWDSKQNFGHQHI